MKVKQVTDASFKKYGKILTGIDFSEIYNVLEKIKYPETGRICSFLWTIRRTRFPPENFQYTLRRTFRRRLDTVVDTTKC